MKKRVIPESLSRWGKLLAGFLSVQILVQIMSALAGILLVRTLSQTEYAFYTMANTMQATMSVLADLGVSSALMATGGHVWQDKYRLGQLIQTGLLFRKKLALAGCLIVTPILWWMLVSHHSGILYATMICGVVLVGLGFQLTNGVLIIVPRLHGRIGDLQRMELATGAIRFGLILVACLTFINTVVGVIIASLSFGLQALLLQRAVNQDADLTATPLSEDEQTIRKVVKQQAANSIYYCLQGQLAVFLIALFGNTSNIAEIGALGRLTMLFSLIASVMTSIVLPRFARCQEAIKLRKMYWQIIGSYAMFSLLLVGGAVLMPRPFLWLLGHSYMHLQNELAFMVLLSALSGLSGTIYTMNASRGWLERAWLAIPITVGLQIVLLPFFDLNSVRDVILLTCLPILPRTIPYLYTANRKLQ